MHLWLKVVMIWSNFLWFVVVILYKSFINSKSSLVVLYKFYFYNYLVFEITVLIIYVCVLRQYVFFYRSYDVLYLSVASY